MEIIKHGDSKQMIKEIVCAHCGCVFSADLRKDARSVYINGMRRRKARVTYAFECPQCNTALMLSVVRKGGYR